ncbi:MAG: SpoIID/LytB domain-containing protein [Peptococcaceae bacterium]|nr:SpoIID/LytB domain-containing protein [Peptococcaceae bacterium]
MRPAFTLRIISAMVVALTVLLPAPGASAATVPGNVRVALVKGADSLSFKVSGNYQLVDQSTGATVIKLNQEENWQVTLKEGRLAVEGRQGRYGPFNGPVLVQELNFRAKILAGNGKEIERYSTEGLVALNAEGRLALLDKPAPPSVRSAAGTTLLAGGGGLNLVSLTGGGQTRRYRGSLEFRVEEGKITAVNELNIEDYLRGVVPAEMPASWPLEALKAQAVAARNFALQRVEATRGRSFNVADDQSSQVYGGYDAESPATDRAVEETRGVVMLSRGSLITAFFHSSSGGCTENSEDVWTNPLPYIKGKEDPYDKNDRHYNWQVEYTAEQLAGLLKGAGYDFKKVTDIEELARTSSGRRVEKIAVRGVNSAGDPLSVEIFNADKVRIALGLKSALFTMKKVYGKDKNLTGVTFTGSGWGHGLGLSQWGACGMARQGYSYQDILKYYYSGISLAGGYGRSPLPSGQASSGGSQPWLKID